MESLYQELKTRFPDYSYSYDSKALSVNIGTPINIYRTGDRYTIVGYYFISFDQIIDVFQELVRGYQYLHNLRTKLEPLFSFFDISSEIVYQRNINMWFRPFDTTCCLTYLKDKLKFRIDYKNFEVEEIYFEQDEIQKCLDGIRSKIVELMTAKHQNQYLQEEYLSDIDLSDLSSLSSLSGLSGLVCHIVNQQNEIFMD